MTETNLEAAAGGSVLEARNVVKAFPGVLALQGVDFRLIAGEIHGVCGENGAGKSTLMKILSGIYQPDQGDITLGGRTVSLTSPLAAKRHGILFVHQELSIVPDLTVAENIFLGELPMRSFSRIDWKRLFADTARVLERLECDFSPEVLAGTLSIAQQQLIEIARAIAFKSEIVIFDEPTASLTQQEADRLFETIRRLRDHGTTIVYISHRMREIFAITDRITVLRDGVVTGVLTTLDTDEQEVTRLMIGRSLDHYFIRAATTPGREVLRIEGISVGSRVRDVGFAIREGEVLGLYGLVGAGRTEIAEAIFGMADHVSGRFFWYGKELTIKSARDAIALGIGLVPEDRKRQGIIPGLGSRANIALAQLDRLTRLGLINSAREHSLYTEYRDKLRIRASGPGQETATMSGGNQQKVVIARWLSVAPRLLILDEPTRGVDVGAKAEIHALIATLAEAGLAVVVISSEMPEIMGIAHRILTVADGRITSELALADFSEDRLIAGAIVQTHAQPLSAAH